MINLRHGNEVARVGIVKFAGYLKVGWSATGCAIKTLTLMSVDADSPGVATARSQLGDPDVRHLVGIKIGPVYPARMASPLAMPGADVA